MRPRERYVRKKRHDDVEKMPFVGQLILFVAGFAITGMIIVLAIP